MRCDRGKHTGRVGTECLVPHGVGMGERQESFPRKMPHLDCVPKNEWTISQVDKGREVGGGRGAAGHCRKVVYAHTRSNTFQRRTSYQEVKRK